MEPIEVAAQEVTLVLSGDSVFTEDSIDLAPFSSVHIFGQTTQSRISRAFRLKLADSVPVGDVFRVAVSGDVPVYVGGNDMRDRDLPFTAETRAMDVVVGPFDLSGDRGSVTTRAVSILKRSGSDFNRIFSFPLSGQKLDVRPESLNYTYKVDLFDGDSFETIVPETEGFWTGRNNEDVGMGTILLDENQTACLKVGLTPAGNGYYDMDGFRWKSGTVTYCHVELPDREGAKCDFLLSQDQGNAIIGGTDVLYVDCLTETRYANWLNAAFARNEMAQKFGARFLRKVGDRELVIDGRKTETIRIYTLEGADSLITEAFGEDPFWVSGLDAASTVSTDVSCGDSSALSGFDVNLKALPAPASDERAVLPATFIFELKKEDLDVNEDEWTLLTVYPERFFSRMNGSILLDGDRDLIRFCEENDMVPSIRYSEDNLGKESLFYFLDVILVDGGEGPVVLSDDTGLVMLGLRDGTKDGRFALDLTLALEQSENPVSRWVSGVSVLAEPFRAKFSWGRLEGAETYVVTLDDGHSQETLSEDSSGAGADFDVPAGDYTYEVKALDGEGEILVSSGVEARKTGTVNVPGSSDGSGGGCSIGLGTPLLLLLPLVGMVLSNRRK